MLLLTMDCLLDSHENSIKGSNVTKYFQKIDLYIIAFDNETKFANIKIF